MHIQNQYKFENAEEHNEQKLTRYTFHTIKSMLNATKRQKRYTVKRKKRTNATNYPY